MENTELQKEQKQISIFNFLINNSASLLDTAITVEEKLNILRFISEITKNKHLYN